MTKLEHDYGLIAKSTPIFSKVAISPISEATGTAKERMRLI